MNIISIRNTAYFLFPLFWEKSINRQHTDMEKRISRGGGEGMLLIKVMPINRVRSMWFCPQSAMLLDVCLPKACGPDGCLVSTRGGSDYDLGLCLFYWILRRTCAELSPESRHKWQDHKSLSSHFSSFINVTVPCFLLSFLFFGHSDVSKFSCSTQWPIYLIKDEKIIGNIVFFCFCFLSERLRAQWG